MYTKVKNIQMLIALLKSHKIKHIVISAGSRHVPFAQSVENDVDFVCYSVVDERSAGYFAIGLYKQIHEPVAIVCTSSTATCNYYPAVYEARQQNIPLLVLTADRHPAYLDQLEDQMILQPGMYGNACKKSVTLPWITTPLESWQCQRLINEALLELNHHGSGPVQINFPNHTNLIDNADLSVAKLPAVKVINRFEQNRKLDEWRQKSKELLEAKRILILCGSRTAFSEQEISAIERFTKHFNCVVATEKVSNLHCQGAVDMYLLSYALTETTFGEILPDIVISFGGNFYSRYKSLLRGKQRRFRHWNINDSGKVVDAFLSLTDVFESSVEYFFNSFASFAENENNNLRYYKAITWRIKKLKFPSIQYSSVEAMYKLTQNIPENSLLHLSILNSTRITEMFDIPHSVRTYSNLGTYGIDGSMSTFLGQSSKSDRLNFLVIGDLSFFYDLNAICISGIRNNVRIMLINNGGAAEFHFSMGEKRIPTINKHIAAEHSITAEKLIQSMGFEYIEVRDSLSLDAGIKKFTSIESDRPIVMEVITSKQHDAEITNSLIDSIKLPITKLPDVVLASPENENTKKASFVKRLFSFVKKVVKKIVKTK